MNTKQRKNYMLQASTVAYLEQLKERRGTSASALLDEIVQAHRDQKLRYNVTSHFADQIADVLEERLRSLLDPIQANVDRTDQQTKVVLEVLNHMLLATPGSSFQSTTDHLSPVLKEAASFVIKQSGATPPRSSS